MEFLIASASETARILYEGSLYILAGFLVAGLLHEFLPTAAIARHLGRDNLRSVGTAALFGAPIPLCSCGVLPAAAALRRKGASRSSTLSFLVSTPETGVDSIALTYGLLGPILAVVRPLVAIVTALVAGALSILVPDEGRPPPPSQAFVEDLDREAHDHGHGGQDDLPHSPGGPWRERSRRVFQYGFVTLLDEIAFWLVMGIALTGLLAALLPDGFFSEVVGWDRGLAPMLAMVVVGIPLYLCASASTPVAAALIAKGLSPGAALVFLLVGPATNAATIAVVGQLLGRTRLRIYLGSIVLVALLAGTLLDWLAADAVRLSALGDRSDPGPFALLKVAAALGFTVLVAVSFQRTRFREGVAEARDQMLRLGAAVERFRWRSLARGPVGIGAAALALVLLGPRSVLVVGPGQRGIVQRFGRVVASDLEPGLHLHLPAPLGRGLAVDVAWVRQVPIGFRGSPDEVRISLPDQAFYLTADENIIDLRAVVHYRVSDPVRFALGLERSDDFVRSLARRALVEITGRDSIDTLYTTDRQPTEAALRDGLRRRVEGLGMGIEILDARLLDVHAPTQVHDAFRDVASALEDREREAHEAGGYAAEQESEARGEATTVLAAAHADSVRAQRLAEAEAASFTGVSAVHDQHPEVTGVRLHLEAIERSLAEPRKYVHGSDGGDVDLWIGTARPPWLDLANPQAAAPSPPVRAPVPGRTEERTR